MSFFKSNKWHFRNNISRKNGNKSNGKHPSLIVGITDDKKKYINLGLTHSDKRGHHKNVEIHDPVNWSKKSYIRNDLQEDDVYKLKTVLNEYKLNPQDVNKILKIIEKHKKKNSH